MKNKILENLSFGIGAITFLLFFIFIKNIKVACIIGGGGSTLYGLCTMFNKEKTGYIFFSIGMAVAIGASLFMLKVLDKADTVIFILCGGTFLLMIVSVIFNILNNINMRKKYSLVIEAEVIDLVKNPNVKAEYYQPIYKYEIDGKVYSVNFPGYKKNFIPKLGDTMTLYVEPEDHASAYFDKPIIEKVYSYASSIFLGVITLIIAIGLLV